MKRHFSAIALAAVCALCLNGLCGCGAGSGHEHTFSADNVCLGCGETWEYTEGLRYYSFTDDSYAVMGFKDTENDAAELVIPYGYEGKPVTSVESWAFSFCHNLKRITIPESVTKIGFAAFKGCDGIAELTIPRSVTEIEDEALIDCSGLTSIQAEQGNPVFHSAGNCLIHTEEKSLYLGCSTSKIPTDGSVTSIKKYAFSGCSGLTELTIPKTVTNLGESAFYKCSGLTSIQVEQGNPVFHSAGNCLIYTESKWLGLGCNTSVIPDDGSVTEIGSEAFWGCSGLTEVTIPDGVTKIWENAFRNCSGLKRLTISGSVVSIGDDAFRGCSGLTTIRFGGTAEAWKAVEKGIGWRNSTVEQVVCTNGTLTGDEIDETA